MKNLVSRIIKDEKGANLVEYIILLGVVALICIAAFSLFGTSIKNKVNQQTKTVNSAINSTKGK